MPFLCSVGVWTTERCLPFVDKNGITNIWVPLLNNSHNNKNCFLFISSLSVQWNLNVTNAQGTGKICPLERGYFIYSFFVIYCSLYCGLCGLGSTVLRRFDCETYLENISASKVIPFSRAISSGIFPSLSFMLSASIDPGWSSRYVASWVKPSLAQIWSRVSWPEFKVTC